MSLLDPRLQAFITVARKQTVLDSAKVLGITQTGVTQRIRSIERQLRTSLFTRSRKGMRLTREGEALLRYCQAASDLEGVALALIQKAGLTATTEVCITGASSILRSRVIPKSLSATMLYRNMRLRFDLSDEGRGVEKLKNGFAQIAILPIEQVVLEMDSRKLQPERYILVGPASWKGRKLLDVISSEHIIDFDPSDEMTFNTLKKFKLYEKALKSRHFANNTDAIASMVAEGLGYSVLTEEFAKPLIKQGRIIDLNSGHHFEHQVALAWYPRSEMPAYFRDLIKAI